MSLADQAAARKEKLKALAKRKADGAPDGAETDPDKEGKKRARNLEFRFRNYDPTIQGPRRHDPVVHQQDTVEETVKDVMERVRTEDELRRAGELDLTKIQPKKPNWDLKRDLMKKMAKLEPVTQAAFATLIRRRMQAEGGTTTGEGAAALVKEMNMAGSNQTLDEEPNSDDDN